MLADGAFGKYRYIYFTNRKPFYHLQVGVIDFTNEVTNWTEYMINTGDPIYQTFREYIMQQLDKGLFERSKQL